MFLFLLLIYYITIKTLSSGLNVTYSIMYNNYYLNCGENLFIKSILSTILVLNARSISSYKDGLNFLINYSLPLLKSSFLFFINILHQFYILNKNNIFSTNHNPYISPKNVQQIP